MLKTIKVPEAFSEKDAIFIDVRTPKEFDKDCIPNAIWKQNFSKSMPIENVVFC